VEFERKAREYADRLAAEQRAFDGHRRRKPDGGRDPTEIARSPNLYTGRRYMAGEKLAGMVPTYTGLGLARGDLGRRKRGEMRDLSPRFPGEGRSGSPFIDTQE